MISIFATVVGAILISWVTWAHDVYWMVHDTHNDEIYLAMDTWNEIETTRQLDSYKQQINEWNWRKRQTTDPRDREFIQDKIEELESDRDNYLKRQTQ
jgi:hypothetical protein